MGPYAQVCSSLNYVQSVQDRNVPEWMNVPDHNFEHLTKGLNIFVNESVDEISV